MFEIAFAGMEWATQTVELPLWAALVLIFVPTSKLIDLAEQLLESTAKRFKHKKKQTDGDSRDDEKH